MGVWGFRGLGKALGAVSPHQEPPDDRAVERTTRQKLLEVRSLVSAPASWQFWALSKIPRHEQRK